MIYKISNLKKTDWLQKSILKSRESGTEFKVFNNDRSTTYDSQDIIFKIYYAHNFDSFFRLRSMLNMSLTLLI